MAERRARHTPAQAAALALGARLYAAGLAPLTEPGAATLLRHHHPGPLGYESRRDKTRVYRGRVVEQGWVRAGLARVMNVPRATRHPVEVYTHGAAGPMRWHRLREDKLRVVSRLRELPWLDGVFADLPDERALHLMLAHWYCAPVVGAIEAATTDAVRVAGDALEEALGGRATRDGHARGCYDAELPPQTVALLRAAGFGLRRGYHTWKHTAWWPSAQTWAAAPDAARAWAAAVAP